MNSSIFVFSLFHFLLTLYSVNENISIHVGTTRVHQLQREVDYGCKS